jgi:hypothetical protein
LIASGEKSSFMKQTKIKLFWLVLVLLAGCCLTLTVSAQNQTLRIVTYNIEDDINGATTPLPGLVAPPGNTADVLAGGVLEGIGEEIVGNDPAQPLDILALEETTSNPITVAPIVNGLNAFYGVLGMYSNSPVQGYESGGVVTSGNGPNALVYNTKTVQLLASAPVDPPGGVGQLGSASGEYREAMRYEFAPAGVATNSGNVFFIYVSHYKSGTGSVNVNDRYGEAKIIRNDEANNLPSTASVLYTGDYNADNPEPMYETLLALAAPNAIQQGQGIDPLNPTNSQTLNWSASTTNPNILALLSESSTDLRYRDDFEVMTANIYYGTTGGLNYVSGTCHTFGNNGTTVYQGSVNSGTDTALNNRLVTNGPVFISATELYLDLTDASDHLPVVADYTITLSRPLIAGSRNVNFDVSNLGAGVTNTIAITNFGSATLVLSNAVITGVNAGDFTIGGLALPATISAGQGSLFTVVFSPLGGGARSATLQISDNDPNNNPFSIALSGTGNAGPTILWSFTNLSLNAAGDCSAAMIDVTGINYIQASDVLGPGALTITQTPAINASLAAGTTNQVVIMVADTAGNTVYSTNWIYVADVTTPVIVSPPVSQTNNTGTTASFTVEATACTPLNYQWYFGTNALAGQTNSTLSLASVGSTNAGSYQVIVSSEGGSTNTAPASLTVIYQAPMLAGGQMMSGANGFQLTFSGPVGQTYTVLASDDLTLPQSLWTIIGTGTFGNTNVIFTDDNATNPAEFYFIESP